MLDLERNKNRIFLKLISLIMLQVFMLTGVVYPEVRKKDINSSYILQGMNEKLRPILYCKKQGFLGRFLAVAEDENVKRISKEIVRLKTNLIEGDRENQYKSARGLEDIALNPEIKLYLVQEVVAALKDVLLTSAGNAKTVAFITLEELIENMPEITTSELVEVFEHFLIVSDGNDVSMSVSILSVIARKKPCLITPELLRLLGGIFLEANSRLKIDLIMLFEYITKNRPELITLDVFKIFSYLKEESKEEALNRILIPLLFKRQDLFNAKLIDSLKLVFENVPEFKYFLFYANMCGIDSDLYRPSEQFPYQASFREMMSKGKKEF